MLVLSRKKNQSIVIDGGIEIQILQLKGGTVKLGIKAPENVRIVRGELDLFSDLMGAGEQSATAGVSEEARQTSMPEDNQVMELSEEYLASPAVAR
jgi:carbon storage regulator CsrA